MRYPATHTFLKWAGPSVLGACTSVLLIIAAFGQGSKRVVAWYEHTFDQWWWLVTAPWFVALLVASVCAYIAALVWTGRPRRESPDIPAGPIIVGPAPDASLAGAFGSMAEKVHGRPMGVDKEALVQKGPTPVSAPTESAPQAPRRLTHEQQAALIRELSRLSPEVGSSQVSFTPSLNESYKYFEGFFEVFTRSGLKPEMATGFPQSPEEVGVMVIMDANTPRDLTDNLLEALHVVGIDAHLIERVEAPGFDLRLYVGPQPL